MNRIVERFAGLKAAGKKGCVVYIGAGDPNLEITRQLALSFDRVGVDILELGVPFSDPLADGLVNQLAAQRGLESGTTPKKVLETVAAIRRESQIPLVLYIYFNLRHRHGYHKFIHDAACARVAGVRASAAASLARLVVTSPQGLGDAVLEGAGPAANAAAADIRGNIETAFGTGTRQRHPNLST